MCISLKVFIAPVIIAEILVLPQYYFKEYARCAAYLDNIWGSWKGNITQSIDADKIVFDDVTVDWCVTCKFNKIGDLGSITTLEMFQRQILLKSEVNLLPKMIKSINCWHTIIELE